MTRKHETSYRVTVALSLLLGAIEIVLAAIALLLFSQYSAHSHDAPTGWRYGFECCSTIDCRQLKSEEIGETPNGYLLFRTGEQIPYGDKRVKQSRDEFFHQCTPGGRIDADRSICLYVPDRGV